MMLVGLPDFDRRFAVTASQFNAAKMVACSVRLALVDTPFAFSKLTYIARLYCVRFVFFAESKRVSATPL